MGVKPGVRTTEFWLTAILALVGPIVTILVGAGVIDASNADAVTDTVTTSSTGIVEAVTVVIANVTALLGVRKYIQGRTDVKTAAG